MWIELLILSTLALEVIQELGDIAVFPNETLSLTASSYFRGSFLDYQVRAKHSQVSLTTNSRFELVSTVPIEGKARKIGPSFVYQSRSYFSLYTSETLELWAFSRGLIVKLWESEVQAIQVIEYLGGTKTPGLFLWSATDGFFYLNCEVAIKHRNATLVPIVSIAIFPAMKVAVCDDNFIVTASSQQFMEFQRYKFDDVSVSVSAPLSVEYNRNSSWIDMICVSELYFLTSDGVFYQQGRIFPSEYEFTVLRKFSFQSWGAAVGNKTIAHLNSGAIMNWLPRLSLLSLSDRTSAIVLGNATYWIMHWVESGWEMMEVALEHSEVIELSWLPKPIPSEELVLVIRSTQIALYSVEYSPMTLEIAAVSGSFELCASDLFDQQQVCTHSVVHIVDSNASIMQVNEFNLSSQFPEKIIQVIPNFKPAQYELTLSKWFSGSNLQYSVEFPQLPGYITVTSSTINSFLEAYLIREFPLESPTSVKCMYIQDVDYNLAVVTKSYIVMYLSHLQMPLYYPFPDPLFNASACISAERQLIIYSEQRKQVIVVENDFILFNQEYYNGIVEGNGKVFAFSNFSVFQIESNPLTLRLVWTSPYEIIDVSTDQPYLWVLSQEMVEKVNLNTNKSVFIPIKPASMLAGYHDKVVCYWRNIIYIYSTVAIRLLTVIPLSEDCWASSLQVFQDDLYVKCEQYLQIIQLLLRSHNAKLLTIPSPNSVVSPNFILRCTLNLCEFISYYFTKERSQWLAIAVTDFDLFLEAEPVSVTGRVIATSGTESAALKLIVELINTGNYIRVNPAWHNFKLEVPWTASLYLPLKELFIGHNISLALQTADSEFQYELVPKFSITNQLQLRYYKKGLFDICADSNVIVYVESTFLVFELYKCLMYWCRSVAHQVSLTEFGFLYLIHLEIYTCQESSVILYLKGFNQGINIEKLLIYDVSSHQHTILYEDYAQNAYRSSHLIRESNNALHIFQISELVVHYILDSNYSLISRDVPLIGIIHKPISIASALVNDEWKVFILHFQGLIECALVHTLVYLRTAPLSLHSTSFSIAGVTSDQIAITDDTSVKVYSLASFAYIRTVHLQSFISQSTPPQHKLSSTKLGLIGLFYSGDLIVLDLSLPPQSEVVGAFNFVYFRFSSQFEAVGYSPADSTITFLHFEDSMLILPANRSRVDSGTWEFSFLAKNSYKQTTSPVFTVHRSKAGSSTQDYHWIIISIFSSAVIAAIVLWRLKRRRVSGASEEIEIVSIDSSNSSTSNH